MTLKSLHLLGNFGGGMAQGKKNGHNAPHTGSHNEVQGDIFPLQNL
jgi:hypothetical protein